MATANRVLPINNRVAAQDGPIPLAAIQSITMAIRVGNTNMAIGYVQEFGWEGDRDVKALHQMEPYPDGTFDAEAVLAADFGGTAYWPGEPVEVIPGKIDVISLTLNRYALYTSTLLAACMRIDAAGTEDENKITTNSEVNNILEINKYVSLIQQVRPITVTQVYISPITGAKVYGRRFEECWFTKIGETIPDADTNEPILEEGELKATRIRPVLVTNGEITANEG